MQSVQLDTETKLHVRGLRRTDCFFFHDARAIQAHKTHSFAEGLRHGHGWANSSGDEAHVRKKNRHVTSFMPDFFEDFTTGRDPVYTSFYYWSRPKIYS